MGPESEFTIGEIARACARIERKVDDQGEVITSVNLRLTAIEATQAETPKGGRAKPMAAGAGLAAVVYGGVQWFLNHLGKGTP